MDLPLDWDNAFLGDERIAGIHAESISDGLVMSLNTLGRVDIEYIALACDTDCKTVIETLRGSIYQNPATWGECFYKGWETSEEYLSGRLMDKLQVADEANEHYNGYFADNVRALERVLPEPVAAEDIYVTIGSPWIPADIIDDFILHLFGYPPRCWFFRRGEIVEFLPKSMFVKHDELTGTWEIPEKSRYGHDPAVVEVYGTSRMNALHIIERTLNQRPITVTDETTSTTNASGKKRIVNQSETVLAIEKQKALVAAFKEWVWSDHDRADELRSIFEERFNCVRRRVFDGQFLTFPTMAEGASLYPYQKDAVARILFSPNTLLAHDVGSGKTYVMVAAGMELRRMGLSTKNLYVVPNNIVGQWRDVFHALYPDADVLCVEPRGFKPDKRRRVLEGIRDSDYDGIVMAYSCFEQIPLSRATLESSLLARKKAIDELLADRDKATHRLKKKREAVERELEKLADSSDGIFAGVCFDELGISRLFVDEAHNFKNIPIDTKTVGVLGISSKGSRRCQDMLGKVRSVQKRNGGGGVVFATGTPITNSITDVFAIQQYLQGGELALLDLQSFDSWAGMFAEQSTEFEIDVDTSTYRMATRFARFHNLPELTSLLSEIADFHQVDVSAGIPECDGYDDVIVAKTDDFARYLRGISMRADAVRRGWVNRRDDNMLKITTDGRKAALDMRLVDPSLPFDYQSKVARCAVEVFDIYQRTEGVRGAQLVFCDTSTPKAGFNLYSELRRLLVRKGVPPTSIAFVHDADSEAKRARLFSRVRRGDVRVLVGSTFKLGLGVNVQERLVALHHLDVPWRPADMTQREGRILRQGNTSPRVNIFRYIAEGSFDAYSWQLLETKQRFIVELLSGSIESRSEADVDDTVLSYAEVKALAVGNPLVKQRVETANKLARCRALQRKQVESRTRLEQDLVMLPKRIEEQRARLALCQADWDYCEAHPLPDQSAWTAKDKQQEKESRAALRRHIAAALEQNTLVEAERPLETYRGFRIVLPANMLIDRPFVWLVRSGKYRVDLDKEAGILRRIDNFIDHLDREVDACRAQISLMEGRIATIEEELANSRDYAGQIADLQEQVRRLDEQLGVIER